MCSQRISPMPKLDSLDTSASHHDKVDDGNDDDDQRVSLANFSSFAYSDGDSDSSDDDVSNIYDRRASHLTRGSISRTLEPMPEEPES